MSRIAKALIPKCSSKPAEILCRKGMPHAQIETLWRTSGLGEIMEEWLNDAPALLYVKDN